MTHQTRYSPNLPKHFDKLVILSMKTFAEITFPNGLKVCSRSESVYSWGRWYIKRLAPSGPSCCFSPGSPLVLAAAATLAAFAAAIAAWIAPEEFCVECCRIFCVVAQFEGTPIDEAMDVVHGFAADNIVGMPVRDNTLISYV